MPSFDIVCNLNFAEVDNAVNQANRELTQRYDFKGTNTSIKRAEKVVTIESSDDYKVGAAYDVLQNKLVKREVSLKSLDAQKVEPSAGGRARQVIHLIEGIEKEKAKDLVKKIKRHKTKSSSVNSRRPAQSHRQKNATTSKTSSPP